MELKKASDFKALPGEANFGPPIEIEAVGGMHLAPEVIAKSKSNFYMTRWPRGLPRHETEPVLRFPHGLMHYGETFEECARRLVGDQLGMKVATVRVLDIDSYMDDAGHWHLEPCLLAEVAGAPKAPKDAAEIVRFTLDRPPPDMTFWTANELTQMVRMYL